MPTILTHETKPRRPQVRRRRKAVLTPSIEQEALAPEPDEAVLYHAEPIEPHITGKPLSRKSFAAMFAAPWALLLAGWAGVHFGVLYPNVDRLDQFCGVASKTPTRIMCSDPRNCSTTEVFMSGTAMQQNSLLRGYCGPDLPDAPVYLPVAMMSPDEQTRAQIKAEIGAMTRAQRKAVFDEWQDAQGGPQ